MINERDRLRQEAAFLREKASHGETGGGLEEDVASLDAMIAWLETGATDDVPTSHLPAFTVGRNFFVLGAVITRDVVRGITGLYTRYLPHRHS
jgi:hypothetical protein